MSLAKEVVNVDTKEYIRLLMTIAGSLISVVGFLMWRILQRIELKVEELHRMEWNCRESLPVRFVNKKEIEQCQEEVDKLWEAINYHEHDELGRVVRQ